MTAYRGNRGKAPLILNFSTRCRWVVNFNAMGSLPVEKNPSSHSIKDWVGPSAGPDISEKRKSLAPKGIPTPDHPAIA
jgi:hypothetical protein